MNSESSTQSENGIQLNTNHFDTIKDFVSRYDSLYKNLSGLESDIQELLKKQEAIVNALEKTRAEEETFFVKLAAETGKDIAYLKSLASAWVIENR
jgi:hypothetical protein